MTRQEVVGVEDKGSVSRLALPKREELCRGPSKARAGASKRLEPPRSSRSSLPMLLKVPLPLQHLHFRVRRKS